MQIAISARDDGGRVCTDDLRGWLGRQRELRGHVKRGAAGVPEPGTMGSATEIVTVFLAPGGVATVLAAALVAWVQNRSGSQTVTISRPDGTEVTVTSDRVKGLTAQQTGDLAQQIAAHLEGPGSASAPAGLEDRGPRQQDDIGGRPPVGSETGSRSCGPHDETGDRHDAEHVRGREPGDPAADTRRT